MIWLLAIYVVGVIVALVLHGIYGNWQDDTLGILNAVIWPLFILYVVLRAPILIVRHIRDSRSKREAPRRETGSARKGESDGAVGNRSMTISHQRAV